VVITAYPGIIQQKLIGDIARAIGVHQKGGKTALIERIVDELRGRDIVLIIDQADYLTDGTLELLLKQGKEKGERRYGIGCSFQHHAAV
jgi:Ni2+-binding GTPase involved in maturation of urease and hydrogenase